MPAPVLDPHPVQYLTIFVTALVGTTIGFLSSVTVAYLNARDTAYKTSYMSVAAKALSAADLGSEYWLLAANSDLNLTQDEAAEELLGKARLLETKILGLTIQIIKLDDQLKFSLPSNLRAGINDARNELLAALTGGNFQSRDGNAEYQSAVRCQKAAADFSAKIHFVLRRRMTVDHHLGKMTKALGISSNK